MPKCTNSKQRRIKIAEELNKVRRRKKEDVLQEIHDNVTQVEVENICNKGIEVEKPETINDTEMPKQNLADCGKQDIIHRCERNAENLTIDTHELLITSDKEEVTPEIKCSRRIVDMSFLLTQLKEISDHGPLGCTMKHLTLVSEKQCGLISKFTFLCEMCREKFTIENDCCNENYTDLNKCAVAGSIATGYGNSQLNEFLASLNLPSLTTSVYKRCHDLISIHWEKVALESMEIAAEKERSFALADGKVNKDGIPIIDFVADGCWSKRSYKKNYSALSGAAAIVGKKTGEILFLGIKNKYCCICAKADKENVIAKDHVCFKNYEGPSTGMESQILVEGFKKSIEQHNLIYGRLISDGDSSTYSKILEARPYVDVTVEKIECRNHLLRNFCNKLQALTTDTKHPLKYRKNITKKSILAARRVIIKSVEKNKEESDIQTLFGDILVSHLHAFGNHSKCKSYFCNHTGVTDSINNDFFLSSLWQRICFIVQNLAAHARSLYYNVDSNSVEQFHSIVAKFVGGKRINFSKKNSYQTRCFAAAASYNEKRCISRLYKSLNKTSSPSGKLKKLETQRIKKAVLDKRLKSTKTRSYTIQPKQNKDYGQDCVKPDIDEESMERLKERFLEDLKKNDEEIQKIERSTILQGQSSEWLELRRSLLTASSFGKIIKRKADTSCASTVKELLYKTSIDHVSSIKHGHENEKKALMQLCVQENITIDPCGLFVDRKQPYFGATPDALCGQDMVIEVKCPLSAHIIGIEEAIKNKKVTFWKLTKSGSVEINKSHHWYYQIQGQLHITQRSKCLFAVWSNENERLKTEIIDRDDSFWTHQMEKKLTTFYMHCILPELIDPRHPRHLTIRDPLYIQEAMQKKEDKKTQKKRDHNKEEQNNQENNKQGKNIDDHNQNPNVIDTEKPSCSRVLSFESF